MDLMRLPLITYFVDWGEVSGTYIMGFIGVAICLGACIACWYQIANDPGT